jgi:hypothetical protein
MQDAASQALGSRQKRGIFVGAFRSGEQYGIVDAWPGHRI